MTEPEIESCPVCFSMTDDLYMHLLWHGIEPLGPRFRKRYEADLETAKRTGRAIGRG